MDIGIDLGTTFSVVAVKGRAKFVEGYPEGRYLEGFDVTIIPTPFGDESVASVFWASEGDPRDVLIGLEAKQKAQEGESPIMFSKRSIGTNDELRTG
jgi:molecular chaperone DnaK (HSP70)